MRNNIFLLLALLVALGSCNTQRQGIKNTGTAQWQSDTPSTAFVGKIIGNAVDCQNITGNASIRVQAGSQSMRLSGALRMRKDRVIRLQLSLPVLGTELGRLEFTPDYVLLLDRINKQYMKVDYSEVDFLENNGITFYSLQALFWNELIAPGKQHAAYEDAGRYSVVLDDSLIYTPITLSNGNMKYQWNASCADNLLTSAVITYNSASYGTSMLSWLYSDFAAVDKKKFPRCQDFSFTTVIDGTSRRCEIKIDMSEIKTSSDWEAETAISSKYKKVNVETALSKLLDF